jgi:two-component system, response regulator PdtaR
MGRAVMAITVLVVEDEFLIRSLVADYLSDSGFDVHEAESGDEALDYLKSGAAVDVLFTDIELPGSLNGVKLAECARKMRPELPVVYASGGPRTCGVGERVPRGRFLPKPYDPAEVCTLLAKLAGPGHVRAPAKN